MSTNTLTGVNLQLLLQYYCSLIFVHWIDIQVSMNRSKVGPKWPPFCRHWFGMHSPMDRKFSYDIQREFVHKSPIINKSTSVQVMARCSTDPNSLTEPVLTKMSDDTTLQLVTILFMKTANDRYIYDSFNVLQHTCVYSIHVMILSHGNRKNSIAYVKIYDSQFLPFYSMYFLL